MNLKLNLDPLKNQKIVGFHEDFMSKLKYFSKSWREQVFYNNIIIFYFLIIKALAEKKF